MNNDRNNNTEKKHGEAEDSVLEEKRRWANRGQGMKHRQQQKKPNNNTDDNEQEQPSNSIRNKEDDRRSIVEEKKAWVNRRQRDSTGTVVSSSSHPPLPSFQAATNNNNDEEQPSNNNGYMDSGIVDSKERIANRRVSRDIRATAGGGTTTTIQRPSQQPQLQEEQQLLLQQEPQQGEYHTDIQRRSTILIQAEIVTDDDNKNKITSEELRERIEAEVRSKVAKEAVQAESVVVADIDDNNNNKGTKQSRRRRKIWIFALVGLVVVAAFASGIAIGVTQSSEIRAAIPWQDNCTDAPLMEGPEIAVVFSRLNATVDPYVEPCPDSPYYYYQRNTPVFPHRGIWARTPGTGDLMTLSYESTDEVAGVYVYRGPDCSSLACVNTIDPWESSVGDVFYLYTFVPDDVGNYGGNVSITIG